MFLRRIQVPDFRVLKNVDLTFEPEFSPRIFPLGSLNGGGKSTLLQLIFILLSCSSDPEKDVFIQNMLEGFEIEKGENQKLLTTIHLSQGNQDIKLQFICHQNEIPIKKITTDEKHEELFENKIKFSLLGIDRELEQEISKLETEIANLEAKYNKLSQILEIKDSEERHKVIEKELNAIKYGDLGSFFREVLKINKNNKNIETNLHELNVVIENLVNTAQEKQQSVQLKIIELERSKIILDKISDYLKEQNFHHICNYGGASDHDTKYALLCNSEQLNPNEANDLLKQLANKIFLAAPFTQVFIFISRSNSKLLFKGGNNKYTYYAKLEDTKRKLPNLFTYDLLSVDYIVSSFKEARDKDFKQAIESQGEYGDAYKNLLNEFNSLLGNKKINLDTDLSGVNFKIETNGETRELYPEDLSHGELKRLSIYVWLKYKQIEDSIVLMDEIENAFHPDWQYQIISDLAEWGASNQYILATHSYELCQALTPAHVKELEPKLLRPEVEN